MSAPASSPVRPPTVSETSPEISLLLRRAYLAQHRGHLGDAEKYVRVALDLQPDSVPALSMLATVLRAKGDGLGAVAAAQRVSELSASAPGTPGAVDRAREDRARVEQQVVAEVTRRTQQPKGPLHALTDSGAWGLQLALAALGLVGFMGAIAAVLSGRLPGHLWLGLGLLLGGWCYHDAENRRLGGLGWAVFVLCLGPFGLAIYLLSLRRNSEL